MRRNGRNVVGHLGTVNSSPLGACERGLWAAPFLIKERLTGRTGVKKRSLITHVGATGLHAVSSKKA